MSDQRTENEQACVNTDHELWREIPGDYYSPSIHVTEAGGIGINVGGHVIVKSLRSWHACADYPAPPRQPEPLSSNPVVYRSVKGVVANLVDALEGERDRLAAEVVSLNEQVAALQSREVCAAAHDQVEECGYCQRDRLRAALVRARSYIYWNQRGRDSDGALKQADEALAGGAVETAARPENLREAVEGLRAIKCEHGHNPLSCVECHPEETNGNKADTASTGAGLAAPVASASLPNTLAEETAVCTCAMSLGPNAFKGPDCPVHAVKTDAP